MTDAGTSAAEAIVGLNRRITEAEMRSTAATDALAALARTGGDTVQAEQMLWEEMDALRALRRQLW
ncbi:hypothetical protein MBRA_06370 [Methylobacterium brachiatum]|jgi:hypothetical protein|nr:hypothetical protein MBRA_06370 [Methylobacterium brachiatum]